MKLNEISPQDTMKLNLKNWDGVAEMKQFLKDKGYNYVGGGAFSKVFEAPNSDKVVKISERGDVCWERYIKAIERYPNNPNLPKVKSLVVRPSKTNNEYYFVAIIEKLEPYIKSGYGLDDVAKKIHNFKDLENIIGYLYIASEGYVDTPKVAQILQSSPYYNEVLIKSNPNLPDNILNFVDTIANEITNSSDSTFAEALYIIDRIRYRHSNCDTDIHVENIMYRSKTNDIVLTDPLADFSAA